jgi:hypothetical protein
MIDQTTLARAVWQGRIQSASLAHHPQPLFGQS